MTRGRRVRRSSNGRRLDPLRFVCNVRDERGSVIPLAYLTPEERAGLRARLTSPLAGRHDAL